MAAHKHLWTMYHAEPDLWLLLLVGRGLVGPHCQRSALASLAKGLHASAALLHGQLSAQLEQVRVVCGALRRLGSSVAGAARATDTRRAPACICGAVPRRTPAACACACACSRCCRRPPPRCWRRSRQGCGPSAARWAPQAACRCCLCHRAPSLVSLCGCTRARVLALLACLMARACGVCGWRMHACAAAAQAASHHHRRHPTTTTRKRARRPAVSGQHAAGVPAVRGAPRVRRAGGVADVPAVEQPRQRRHSGAAQPGRARHRACCTRGAAPQDGELEHRRCSWCRALCALDRARASACSGAVGRRHLLLLLAQLRAHVCVACSGGDR
jgi:hypothetical protein